MPRYGTFTYGTELYGAGGETDNLLWAVEVDWDGDGVFDGSNEGLLVKDVQVTRGRQNFLSISGAGEADGFSPFSIGVATVVLDNEDQRYNPYNTSSPLYPNVEPGKLARVRVFNGTGDAGSYLITGKITDIRMSGERNRRVTLRIEDGMRFLADANVSIDLTTSVSVDTAVGNILDDISYPWGRDLDSSALTIPYWWADGKALGELNDLARSGLGAFFVAANGDARYVTPQDVPDAESTLTSADVLKEIQMPQPWEVTRNYVKLLVHPREEQPTSTLWQISNVVTLVAGESITFWASYSYGAESPVPAASVITPVATTDYLFNALPDGSGTNLTSSLGVTFTNFGSTAKIVVTNNHGSTTGTITQFKVRGNAVASPDVVRLVRSSGTGDRALVMDLKWVQDTNTADDFATYLLAWLTNVQIFPTVTLEMKPDKQFSYDLYDVLTLTVDYLGIDADYRVAGIEHRWMGENGQAVSTTLTLEPVPTFAAGDFWTFPTELGVTSILGFSG